MSLIELRPAVQILSRHDKFLLVQELIAELAKEADSKETEFPVWSPYDAHSAAATLLELLKQGKTKAITT